MSKRLMFVPETPGKYADTYRSYCNDAMDLLCSRTGTECPYDMITNPQHEKPEIPEDGIEAFFVHNLAKEFRPSYIFSNRKGKRVKVCLRVVVFTGEMGSYSSTAFPDENGSVRFERDNHTIWQDRSENPYRAFMVPVEETIHVSLRNHTERAIKHCFDMSTGKGLGDLAEIIDRYIALEEAAAGGVVNALLPGFLRKHAKAMPESLISEDLEARSSFPQYKHLRRGIEAVRRLGPRKAIEIYSGDPDEFGRLL
jgi:hypothetical protein